MIELACGEYGDDKIDTLVAATQNGRSVQWCDNFEQITTYPPTGMFFSIKKLVVFKYYVPVCSYKQF